jgi:Flp pilus assembly CpaF family ATPase
MLNADGRLWVDRAGRGREDTGRTIGGSDAEAALRLIAHDCGVPLTRTAPVLSGTLPRTGERIAATSSSKTPQEIRIEAPDHVRMLTSPEVPMRALVQLSLRYRPDRIILGEDRSGDAAIELIHAMNTGLRQLLHRPRQQRPRRPWAS